jgi:hypothetical protein
MSFITAALMMDMETVSETLNVTSVSYSIWLITQEDIIEYS